MTKYFTITGISILLFLSITGCLGSDCSQDIEDQNMAIVRHMHAEVAKKNMAIFDEYLSTDYIRHCQAMPPDLQEMRGTKQFIGFVTDFYTNTAPDLKETIELMMADDDKVAYVLKMTGTQSGTMGQLPASGKQFELTNMVIHRFEEGKIAETWVSWDNVAMLSQLGFLPPPPPSSLPITGDPADR